MDAIFPAVIGAGIYLMYYAWESHVKGTVPHPVKKLTAAIKGESYTEEPSGGGVNAQASTTPSATAAAGNPQAGQTINPNTGTGVVVGGSPYLSGKPIL